MLHKYKQAPECLFNHATMYMPLMANSVEYVELPLQQAGKNTNALQKATKLAVTGDLS